MNEMSLPNDINQIELEIQWHKENTGRSIWEIGRRLNHVKENDLVHGEFMNWCEEEVGITSTQANKFMKIANEFEDSKSTLNLGVEALYLITTLPDEQKEHYIERSENGNSPTVKELKEQRKRNRELEKQLEQSKRSEELTVKRLEREQNKEPEVVEKEIVKEVVPEDYEELKENNEKLMQALQRSQEEKEQIKEEVKELKAERQNEPEGSRRYEELTQAIQEMEGQMTRGQKRIQAQKDVYELVSKSKELLIEITPIPYVIDAEYVKENEYARKALLDIADQTDKFLDNLRGVLDESRIIEGVVIDE